MSLNLEANVDRGVAFLDTLDPLWFQKINTDILNMMSCYRCCLGQLFGNYITVQEQLWGDEITAAPDINATHGFTIAYSAVKHLSDAEVKKEFRRLTELWCERIQMRLAEFAGITATARYWSARIPLPKSVHVPESV